LLQYCGSPNELAPTDDISARRQDQVHAFEAKRISPPAKPNAKYFESNVVKKNDRLVLKNDHAFD